MSYVCFFLYCRFFFLDHKFAEDIIENGNKYGCYEYFSNPIAYIQDIYRYCHNKKFQYPCRKPGSGKTNKLLEYLWISTSKYPFPIKRICKTYSRYPSDCIDNVVLKCHFRIKE